MSLTQNLISDALCDKIEPLLSIKKTNHPLNALQKHADNSDVINDIIFVIRKGCQWNLLIDAYFVNASSML